MARAAPLLALLPAPPRAVAVPAPPQVVLRYRDGTTQLIDPGSETAAALQTLAVRLRTGR